MKTVAFTTLGCRVNQYDTDAMKGLFLQNNYEAVDFDEKADIYVINTCSVTNMGEKKSRQLIRKAKRQNEKAYVIVTVVMLNLTQMRLLLSMVLISLLVPIIDLKLLN